jgi:hypothetical protein
MTSFTINHEDYAGIKSTIRKNMTESSFSIYDNALNILAEDIANTTLAQTKTVGRDVDLTVTPTSAVRDVYAELLAETFEITGAKAEKIFKTAFTRGYSRGMGSVALAYKTAVEQ